MISPAAVHELIFQREMARKRRDWAWADWIRAELRSQGVELLGTDVDPHCRWARKRSRPYREAAALGMRLVTLPEAS